MNIQLGVRCSSGSASLSAAICSAYLSCGVMVPSNLSTPFTHESGLAVLTDEYSSGLNSRHVRSNTCINRSVSHKGRCV
jgi:hypothetical protein